VLFTNGEGDLGEKTTNLDVGDAPDELIASTDAAESAAPLFNGRRRFSMEPEEVMRGNRRSTSASGMR
jgi:hypothetical protein